MMTRLFFLLASLASFTAFASPSCELSPAKLKVFLSQDFDTFDQKPNGWRSLYDGTEACNLTIALLVDGYHMTNQSKMLPWQDRLSYWHAGQSYAFLGLPEVAVERFSHSFDPDEQDTPDFHWNAYVRASLAFLSKDRAALEKARDEFTKVAPLEANNYKIVERFLRCFDTSYFEAYSGTGTCQ
jgi:hypothetical protein